jgi:hypothetical protein
MLRASLPVRKWRHHWLKHIILQQVGQLAAAKERVCTAAAQGQAAQQTHQDFEHSRVGGRHSLLLCRLQLCFS